jgi:hypothetical protein
MKKFALLALSTGLLATVAVPAYAQGTVNTKARQKATFYNAPREIQIIDERPMVRDFREAPQHAQSIELPPGPGEHRGMYGGGGGALPDEGGVIPSGGIPIGGNGGDPGYRTPIETSPVGLDKADLNHRPSNIPAAGLGPKGPLPGGFTTGVHGRVSAPNYPQGLVAGPAQSGGRRPMVQAPKGPQTASYTPTGAGYGNSVGTGSGKGGANSSVRGVLLNKLK